MSSFNERHTTETTPIREFRQSNRQTLLVRIPETDDARTAHAVTHLTDCAYPGRGRAPGRPSTARMQHPPGLLLVSSSTAVRLRYATPAPDADAKRRRRVVDCHSTGLAVSGSTIARIVSPPAVHTVGGNVSARRRSQGSPDAPDYPISASGSPPVVSHVANGMQGLWVLDVANRPELARAVPQRPAGELG
jgi:hypothetical protein